MRNVLRRTRAIDTSAVAGCMLCSQCCSPEPAHYLQMRQETPSHPWEAVTRLSHKYMHMLWQTVSWPRKMQVSEKIPSHSVKHLSSKNPVTTTASTTSATSSTASITSATTSTASTTTSTASTTSVASTTTSTASSTSGTSTTTSPAPPPPRPPPPPSPPPLPARGCYDYPDICWTSNCLNIRHRRAREASSSTRTVALQRPRNPASSLEAIWTRFRWPLAKRGLRSLAKGVNSTRMPASQGELRGTIALMSLERWLRRFLSPSAAKYNLSTLLSWAAYGRPRICQLTCPFPIFIRSTGWQVYMTRIPTSTSLPSTEAMTPSKYQCSQTH
eukprot:jgi/Botrbrau1/5659/Bobra.0071s0005.1